MENAGFANIPLYGAVAQTESVLLAKFSPTGRAWHRDTDRQGRGGRPPYARRAHYIPTLHSFACGFAVTHFGLSPLTKFAAERIPSLNREVLRRGEKRNDIIAGENCREAMPKIATGGDSEIAALTLIHAYIGVRVQVLL